MLADPYHQQRRRTSWDAPPQPDNDTIRDAMANRPTILYLHGAAASRAVGWRIHNYLGFTSRLQANVLVFDYRGFGDSTGVPDESGLGVDAYTAWNWLLEHGAKQEDILIIGHSLGTGVGAQLMQRLASQGVKPRGIALLAPFSSTKTLAETYALFGVPILQPLQHFSSGRSKCLGELIYFGTLWLMSDTELVRHMVRHDFDTLAAIQVRPLSSLSTNC